jgi:hypothetical protein
MAVVATAALAVHDLVDTVGGQIYNAVAQLEMFSGNCYW